MFIGLGVVCMARSFSVLGCFTGVACCSRSSSKEGTGKLFISPWAGSHFVLSQSRSTLRGWSHPSGCSGVSALCLAVHTSTSVWSSSAVLNCLHCLALLWLTTQFLCVSARHVLKERKWEAFLHVCSSADGRCEVRDHRRALLPLHGQQHTPTAPHCRSCPVRVSSSSLPSASPQLMLRSFCHSFALHQNSYCVDICFLPYLPCLLWLSCAEKLNYL